MELELNLFYSCASTQAMQCQNLNMRVSFSTVFGCSDCTTFRAIRPLFTQRKVSDCLFYAIVDDDDDTMSYQFEGAPVYQKIFRSEVPVYCRSLQRSWAGRELPER